MATATKYTYSIQNDTLNHKVDTAKLLSEIRQSSITIAIQEINTEGDILDIWFRDVLTLEEQSVLTGIVNAHDGIPAVIPQSVTLENVTTCSTEKALKVATTLLEGSSSTMVGPNMCDSTTWYNDSVRVTLETLNTSDNQNFTSPNSRVNWINLVSGKIPYEDRISSSYKTLVYVDDVSTTTGFTVDYALGKVTFEASQEGKAVKATYSYENGSTWKIQPASGKILKLLGTKIRFSDDCVFNNECGHIYFQPFYTNAQGQETPAGLPTIYKNMMDVIKCSSSSHRFEKFGILPNDMIELSYDYITSKDLKYSEKTYLKIWLSGHKPLTGLCCTLVGFIVSLNE